MHLAPEAKPHKLYKYVSADGARQILREGKIRCSSPVLFNDPFDGQIEAAHDFSNQALADYMAQRVMEFSGDGSPIPAGASEVFKNHYERFKELLAAGKSKDETIKADALIRQLAETLSEPNEVPRFKEPIKWSKIQRDFRVSSFSETHKSIIMWSHTRTIIGVPVSSFLPILKVLCSMRVKFSIVEIFQTLPHSKNGGIFFSVWEI